MVLFTLFMLLLQPARAYDCPSSIYESGSGSELHRWLSPFVGRHWFGDCEIEIVACTQNLATNDSAPLAELLITTNDGREAYVSVDLQSQTTDRMRTSVDSGRFFLHFEKSDRYFEEINGRTEVWRLELRADRRDTGRLKLVELGIYTTNHQLNQPNGNDSRWYVCKSEQ